VWLVYTLPRYVLHERGYMPWQDVRPSLRLYVCLSVTRRYCVETAETTKHIIKLDSPSGSHTVLIIPYQTMWQNSDVDPKGTV